MNSKPRLIALCALPGLRNSNEPGAFCLHVNQKVSTYDVFKICRYKCVKSFYIVEFLKIFQFFVYIAGEVLNTHLDNGGRGDSSTMGRHNYGEVQIWGGTRPSYDP